jgi:hypothetical protein
MVKKLQKSCPKVVQKLLKSWQKLSTNYETVRRDKMVQTIVQKLSKNVKKL